MIEIKFEGATGAEIRKEMMNLLGLNNYFVGIDPAVPGQDKSTEVTTENGVVTDVKIKEEIAPDETPKPEQTTRKRRTAAEVKAAETVKEETPADTVKEEAPAEEVKPEEAPATDAEPAAVTAEDLTRKCVELGRAGKREDVLNVLETSFGGATIAKKDGKPQLTVDQYEAVMEALNAIG